MSLLPPGPNGDPRETLRWVRGCEIVTGVAAIVFGLALWNLGLWHWLLLATGVLGVLPWPGAAHILRKAERGDAVLNTDPSRRRARGRRAAVVLVPIYLIGGCVFGYLLDRWWCAAFIGGVMGFSAALGMLLTLRRLR